MARNEQLVRQHKILQILERVRFGKTIDEIRDDLVDELGLSSLHTRSVRRDLDALQAAGIDVAAHDSPRGRVWKLGPKAKSTYKIAASSTELIALSLGRDLLYPLAGTPFWSGIESFWKKIQDGLPDTVVNHYERYRQFIHVIGRPAKSYEQQQGILKTLHRAIVEHRVVEIDYQSVGKPVSRRQIEPYAIVFYQSSLYIVAGACEAPVGDGRVRRWKLDRFHKATALDQWFKRPTESELKKHLGPSRGIFGGKLKTFRIRISPLAAPWVVEDPWHPQQEVKPLESGGIELAVKAAHDMEIVPRVLALGQEAELITPVSARRLIAQMVHQMMDRYRDVDGQGANNRARSAT